MDIVLYNFRKEIAIKLLKEGYEVYITFPYGDRVEYFENLGCKFIETKVDRRGINIFKDTKLLFSYIKIMKKIKPDIVLTYTIKPNIYGGFACRIKKIPYLTNITGLGTGIEKNNILTKIILRMYKMALKKANCVFCQNQEILDFLNKNQIAGNLRIIPRFRS